MKTVISQTETVVEVGRYEKQIQGRTVAYSLLKKNDGDGVRYGVCIFDQKERESCYLSGDLFASVAFLEMLVKGDVFPYSLGELVEDFWNMQKI